MKEIREKAESLRKKGLAQMVNAELERRAAERMPYELKWRLNINFEKGEQYCDIAEVSGQIYSQEKQYFWQEREVFNHIAPIIEARLARLSQIRPLMSVRPSGSDESDRQNAMLCRDILHSVYYRLDMPQLIKEATRWSELCGSAFYKVVWDGEASNGGVRCGDVSVKVCPPFEIFPDSCSYRDVGQCRSIIHSRIIPCSQIEHIYGVKVKPISSSVLSKSMLSPERVEDCAVVSEYYQVPDGEFKNGRMLIVASDELIYEGELPYINGENGKRELPFVKQEAMPDVSGFFGTSVIERCIPIQRAYNAVKNRKHEYLNRAAFGVVAVEEGAVDMNGLEQDGLCPGKVLVYRSGSNPPQMMPVGQLPNEFAREEVQLLQEFEMISGVSEMMRRSYAGAATSGVALSLLNDQDNTRLAVTSESIRDAAKNIAKMWLRLYRQFATEPRLIQVAGENGSVTKLYFKGSQLSSDDVVHETENELSQNVTQRRQMLFDLMARGMFSDNGIQNSQKARIFAALGMGDWESCDSMASLQEKAAKRENEGIASLKVSVADDHGVHLQEHGRYMMTEEFEKAEREDPARAQAMTRHYIEHLEALNGR